MCIQLVNTNLQSISMSRKLCNLFETEAQERALKVETGVEYNIFFHLSEGQTYEGYININFKTKPEGHKGLFLDYCGDSVDSLLINGEETAVTEENFKNGHIYLPDEHIRPEDHNLVEIRFSNRYYTDGNGLHTYTDIDGSQYLYIQSEPFWNNRVLPLFDQPDIKGHFSLTAIIPTTWFLITSEDPVLSQDWATAHQPINGLFHNKYFQLFKEKNIGGSNKIVSYAKSKLLPTYLFAFCCGPYKFFELAESERYNNIPMKIYCRDTMVQFIQHQTHQFFSHHKVAIEYYEKLFGMEYMFNKSDMIICPEYTIGAMEYPGAITYSEALFARGKPAIREVSTAGRVGMHELSHMWFGDCVTSYWWNDTWLKESFADYSSYLAATECANKFDFPIEDSWINFLVRKIWGYDEDSKSTTHPIAAQIKSTEEADGVFDGISYAKGAAVLKQLVYVVGLEKWSEAMKVYFQRKAWGNARLDDLIDIYQEVLGGEAGSNLDMKKWKEDWLETPGTNIISVSWSTASKTVTFNQTAVLQQFPKLRFHKILVSTFGVGGTRLETREVFVNNEAETKVDFENINEVLAILPNDHDHDFVKINLDPISTEYFKKNVNMIQGELTQACIYKCLYDMVLEGTLPPVEFVDFVIKNYNSLYSVTLMNTVSTLFRTIFTTYLTDAQFRAASKRVCEVAYTNFKKHLFKDTFGAYNFCLLLDYSFDHQDIERLKVIYDAVAVGLIGGELNLSNKWIIVNKIYSCSAYPKEERERYYNKLWEEDKSDTKVINKAMLDVMLCDTDEKLDEFFEQSISDPLPFSYKVLQYKLGVLNSYYFSEATRAKYLLKYYSIFDQLTAGRSRSICKSFLTNLFPKVDDLSLIETALRESIGRLGSDVKFARKVCTQRIEDIQIVMRARIGRE